MSDNFEDTGLDKLPDEDFTPWKTLRNALNTYGVLAILGWLAFEYIRQRYPIAYYTRDRSSETTCATVERVKHLSFFKWIIPMYQTSDDTILRCCGMDTLFFLRFLRLCEKVAGGVIILSFALAPIYYFAPPEDETTQAPDLDPLYRMSLSNVSSKEIWRLSCPVIGMYIISAWTCYLLWREYIIYAKRRHDFLSREHTMQYSVVINGLPKTLRTQQTLREYFEILFPDSVLHTHVMLECETLEKLQKERLKIRDKLEHYLAEAKVNGKRPLTTDRFIGGNKVDAINMYQRRLRTLNKAVGAEIRDILKQEADIAHGMLSIVDTQYNTSSHVHTHNTKGMSSSNSSSSSSVVDELMMTTVDMHDGMDETSEANYLDMIKSSNRFQNTGIMRGAGFVTFNSLKAAQSATQVLQSADPTKMTIEAAPHIDDMVWENIGVSFNQKSTWRLISLAMSVGIMLFWTFPTSFVVSLSKLESITNKWAWLKQAVETYPWLAPILEQLSPLMLSIMASLAPNIFGVLSKREGHSSGAQVEASLLNKLIAYQWFIVLLLPIFLGTLLQTLTGKAQPGESLTDISYLLDTIGKAMPVQSSFYTTYLLVQTGLSLSLELLRVTPIIKAKIYEHFAPKLTKRERESPWFTLEPLTSPGTFGQTDLVAQYYLVLLLCLIFCSIAPIVGYMAFIYLILSDLVYRWFVLCVADPSPHTFGVFFPTIYNYTIIALAFAQIVMAVLMGTKKAPIAATFALVLPFCTGVFHLFIISRYPRVATYLPLDDAVKVDLERSKDLAGLQHGLENIYKQPAMAIGEPIAPEEDYDGYSEALDGDQVGQSQSHSRSQQAKQVYVHDDRRRTNSSEIMCGPQIFQIIGKYFHLSKLLQVKNFAMEVISSVSVNNNAAEKILKSFMKKREDEENTDLLINDEIKSQLIQIQSYLKAQQKI